MTEATAKQAASSSVPSDKKLAKAVERANQAFTEKNIRFTKLRQDVFEEIAATHASIGAYDILAKLAEKGTRLAPISVYRAIDALLEAGVIHRLESKNAFFACRRMDHRTGRRPSFFRARIAMPCKRSIPKVSSIQSTGWRARRPSSRR